MKMNNLALEQQEQSFKEYLGYEEYLRDNNPPPSNNELNHMESLLRRTAMLHKDMLRTNTLNKTNYQPLQGA